MLEEYDWEQNGFGVFAPKPPITCTDVDLVIKPEGVVERDVFCSDQVGRRFEVDFVNGNAEDKSVFIQFEEVPQPIASAAHVCGEDLILSTCNEMKIEIHYVEETGQASWEPADWDFKGCKTASGKEYSLEIDDTKPPKIDESQVSPPCAQTCTCASTH